MHFSFKRITLSVSRSNFTVSHVYKLYDSYFRYYSGHEFFSFTCDKRKVTFLPYSDAESRRKFVRQFLKEIAQEFEFVKRIKGKSALFQFVLNPGIRLPFTLSSVMENNLIHEKFNKSKIKENNFNLSEITLHDFVLNYLILADRRLDSDDEVKRKEKKRKEKIGKWERWFFDNLLKEEGKLIPSFEVFVECLDIYREFFYGMIHFLRKFYPYSRTLCFIHDNTGFLHAHVMMSPLIVKKSGGRQKRVEVKRMVISRDDLFEQRSYLEKKIKKLVEKAERLKNMINDQRMVTKRPQVVYVKREKEQEERQLLCARDLKKKIKKLLLTVVDNRN